MGPDSSTIPISRLYHYKRKLWIMFLLKQGITFDDFFLFSHILKSVIPYQICTAPSISQFQEPSWNSKECFHILKEMFFTVIGACFPKTPKASFKYHSHCCFLLSSQLSKTNHCSNKNQQNVALVCLKSKPELHLVSQATVGDAVSSVTSPSRC